MMRLIAAVALVACIGVCLAADAEKKESIPWRSTKDIQNIELLGDPLGVPILKLLPAMARPDGTFVQPMWYRAPNRQLHFVTLDLAKGTFKRFPVVGAHEVWRPMVFDGKLYLGYNVPSHFGIYDPATDTLKVHEKIFEKGITVYSMAKGPEGVLVLGAANGSTEVATYDPKTDELKNHGPLTDDKHNYVYYVSLDKDYIYGACRGKMPWHLVSMNRTTGATKVIATADVASHMSVGGSYASATDMKTKDKVYWRLENGNAVKLDGPPAYKSAPPAPKPPMPTVTFDPDSVYADGKVAIRYRLPDAAPDAWQTAKLEVALEHKSIQRIILTDDKTIVGTSGNYGPMFRFDTTTDELTPLGPPSGNTYSIGKSGGKVYVGGYPSTWLDEVKPFEPFTPTTDQPGAKEVKRDAPNANPRRVTYFSNVKQMNSHQAVRLHTGPDGVVWVIGVRHRYYRGFALAWYDPATKTFDKYDDGGKLNHLQISWSCPLADGKSILISTWVQPNDQMPGKPPADAKLLVFDMGARKFTQEFTPFPGEKALGYVVQAPDKAVVGLITESAYPKPPRSVLYRFDLEKGEVTATREYEDVIGMPPSFGSIPRSGPSFTVGPDGDIYTLYRLGSVTGYPWLLIRISPTDLSVAPLGRVGTLGRSIFVGDDLYLGGMSQLRRIKDVAKAAE